MFIAVLVNLHLVRGMMSERCIRLRFGIVVTGLQNLGDAVEFSVSLGVHSYVTVNDDRSCEANTAKRFVVGTV